MVYTTDWRNAPADAFILDLTKIGLMINANGQIVDKETGRFCDIFVSDSERFNDVYKEAIHECARKAITCELATVYNVKEVFLTGANGTDVEKHRPDEAHVTILATNLDQLKHCEDVVIVIGEHDKDLGIWSYRDIKNEPGLVDGSVVGLVKKLQEIKLGGDGKVSIFNHHFLQSKRFC